MRADAGKTMRNASAAHANRNAKCNAHTDRRTNARTHRIRSSKNSPNVTRARAYAISGNLGASIALVALAHLSDLDKYYATGDAPPGAGPDDPRTFYSPVDDVHGALVALIKSAVQSIFLAMYGFDDQDLADTLLEKLEAEHLPVMLTLDSSQASGVHEKRILAKANYPASSIAVGRSEKGAIMHLKEGVIDGLDRFSGSTNWSDGGEKLQDNELTVVRHPVLAGKATARITAIHMHMLQAGAAK